MKYYFYYFDVTSHSAGLGRDSAAGHVTTSRFTLVFKRVDRRNTKHQLIVAIVDSQTTRSEQPSLVRNERRPPLKRKHKICHRNVVQRYMLIPMEKRLH